MRPLPTSASFLITEDCNLACTYCFEKHNTAIITKEVIENGIDYLVDNAIKMGEPEIYTMIFGGEPLLHPDLVDHLLTYGRRKTRANGLRFSNNIVTNATLFNADIERMLKTHIDYLSVQLSVDGVKEVQDMYRIDRAGKGTFDRVLENVPKFKAVFEGYEDKLSIHGVVNRNTMPRLSENYFYFRETLGIRNVWFMPIHTDPWTADDVTVYDRELSAITDYILEKDMASGTIAEGLYYAPIDKCLKPDQRSSAPCGAGKTFVTVTANGDLYPCHQFYFNDPAQETKIGDIFTGIIEPNRELFVIYAGEDLSCRKTDPDCDAYHCYQCIGDNYTTNGSILSQVTGHRCGLSKVERKYQLKVKEAYIQMGLLAGKCNHDHRQPGCDVVVSCSNVSKDELMGGSYQQKVDTVLMGILEHLEELQNTVNILNDKVEQRR